MKGGQTRLTHPRFIILSVFILIGILSLFSRGALATSSDPIQNALARMHRVTSFQFNGNVTQMTVPAATLDNIGRTDRINRMHLQGEASQPDQTMRLRLWSNDGSAVIPQSGIEVEIDEYGQARMRQGHSAWKEVDGFADMLAPQGDLLGYLRAAHQVQPHPTASADAASDAPTRYTFEIDSQQFAAYVRDQLEAYLQAQGELPVGTRLSIPEQYREMRGSGELWIGEDGLPLRQLLTLEFPPQNDHSQRVEIRLDFSDFEKNASWWFAALPAFPTSTLLALGLVGFLAFALIRWRTSRRLRALLALSISAILITEPLLMSIQQRDFHLAMAAETEEQENTSEERQQQRNLQHTQQTLLQNPRQDPLARARSQLTVLQQAEEVGGAENAIHPADQEWLERYSALNPDDPTDTDGDGLTDYVEVTVGTNPDFFDSDSDGITDTLEVQGFQYGGQMWYTDPLFSDSNQDTLSDSIEWIGRDGDDLPDDTDNDGVPDLFDDDNDGDGVPDQYDVSPWTQGNMLAEATTPHTYTKQAPFELTINNLAPEYLTIVDIQVRPTNPDHLQFASSVFDWPYDRRAMIQDADGLTFADVGSGSGENNENGDMRVIPMLEITVPDGKNLPDAAILQQYSISVVDLTDEPDGPKQLYVPLNLVSDSDTGEPYAFTSRLVYQADAEWSAAHEVRMVWAVEVLNDVCKETSDNQCASYRAYNQSTIVHVYNADWHLTGLNVREDHGTDLALMYEDPAIDEDLFEDGYLWMLASALEELFLVPHDDDGDGKLDVTIAEILERFNHPTNDGYTEDERWGLPDTFRVETASYGSLNEAILTTAMTETQRILDEQFTAHWSEASPIIPLILMARSEQYRAMNLDVLDQGETNPAGYVQANNGRLTIDMAPDGSDAVTTETFNGISWSAYCAEATDTGADWGTCDDEIYWDELEQRYATSIEQDAPDADTATGQMVAIQLFYTLMKQGIHEVVQQGSDIVIPDVTTKSPSLVASMLKQGVGKAKTVALFFIGIKFNVEKGTTYFKKLGDAWQSKLLKSGFQGFKSSFMRLSFNTQLYLAGIGVVGVIVLTGAIVHLFVKLAQGDPTARIIVEKVAPSVVNGAFLVYSIIDKCNNIYDKIKQAENFKKGFNNLHNVSRASLYTAAIGIAVEVLVAGAMLTYLAVANDLTFWGREFNVLLSETLASLMWGVFLTMISLIPYVGIVVAILALIDIAFTSICEAGVDELRNVPGLDGACFSIGTLAQKWGSKLVYSYQPMIDLNRAELTTIGEMDIKLQNEKQGYTGGNGIEVTLPVTSVVVHRDPPWHDWPVVLPYMVAGGALDTIDATAEVMAKLDPHQDDVEVPDEVDAVLNGLRTLALYNEKDLRSSTFKYSLFDQSATLSVGRNQMNDEWDVTVDHIFIPLLSELENAEELLKLVPDVFEKGVAMYRGVAPSQHAPQKIVLETGVNFTPPLYLITGYAVPVYECWSFPATAILGVLSGAPPPICYKRTLDGSTSSPMNMLVFDVLPPTFDVFVQLTGKGQNRVGQAWDDHMPGLRDADNDGLLSPGFGGLDPDDATWDADGDRITDATELELRRQGVAFNTRFRDTDGDGLTDRQELFLTTDPANNDTDNDGLLDSEEVYHQVQSKAHPSGLPIGEWTGGWTLTITGSQELTIRVNSSPRNADGDGDGISDLAEKHLAAAGLPYHPQVFNATPVKAYADAETIEGFVAPGQHFPYTTTVIVDEDVLPLLTTSILDIASSPAMGLREITAFGFAPVPTTTLESRLLMPSQTESGRVGISSTVRARLVPEGNTGWTWHTPLADDLSPGASVRGVANTANTRDRQDSYLLTGVAANNQYAGGVSGTQVPVGDVLAYVLAASGSSSSTQVENDSDEPAPYAWDHYPSTTPPFLRGEHAPSLAASDNGRTMVTWDQTAHCTDVEFVELEVIQDNDHNTDGIEPSVRIKRDGNQNSVSYFSGCDKVDPNNAPSGDKDWKVGHICGINETRRVCGSATVIFEEVDDNPEEMDTDTLFVVDNSGTFSPNFVGSDPDNGDTAEVEIRGTIHSPAGGWHQVAGAIINPDTSEVVGEFNLADGGSFDADTDEHYQPVVDSDGSNFLVVWEVRQSTFVYLPPPSDSYTINASTLFMRRFDQDGNPLGAPQTLAGPFIRHENGDTNRSAIPDIRVVWAGDRYRVAWRTLERAVTTASLSARIMSRAVAADGSPMGDEQVVVSDARTDELGAPALGYNPQEGHTRLLYTEKDDRLMVVEDSASDRFDTFWQITGRGFYPRIVYHAPTQDWLTTWFNYHTLSYRMGSDNAETYEWSALDGHSAERDTMHLSCPAPTSAPVFDLRFEELPGGTSFADTSPYGHDATCAADECPQAGAAGAPRADQSDLAAFFDGTSSMLTLNHAEAGDFSLAFWLKSDQQDGSSERWFDGMGLVGNDVEDTGGDYGVSLGNGHVVFGIGSTRPDGSGGMIDTSVNIQSSTPLADGEWHFVVATRDQSSGTINLYVDGALDATDTAATVSLDTPSELFVGATRPGGNYFRGEIDHLRMFPAEMSEGMVRALYERTDQSFCLAAVGVNTDIPFLRMPISYELPRGGIIAASAGLTLTVDGDAPTSAIRSLEDGQYIQGSTSEERTLIIGGEASDAGVGVAQVHIQVNGHPPEAAEGLETWSYALHVQEGAYAIQSRAVDRLGHQESTSTTSNTLSVIADGTAPVMESAFAATGTDADLDMLRELRPRRGEDGHWSVSLRGSISDPAIGDLPGSGVDPTTARVLLQGLDDNAHGNQWQPVTVTGDTWSVRYRFADPQSNPGGSYRLIMTAADMVGNTSGDDLASLDQQQAVQVVIPKTNPTRPDVASSSVNFLAGGNTASATTSATEGRVAADPVSITGEITLTDQTAAGLQALELSYLPIAQVKANADSILRLRLDEPAGSVWFEDDSVNGGSFGAGCVAGHDCPISEEPGRIDQALRFTGSSPLRVDAQSTLNAAHASSFSVQAWVRTSAMTASLLHKHDHTTGYELGINAAGQAALTLNEVVMSGGDDVRDDGWHHIVGVVNSETNQVRLYVDGAEVQRKPFSGNVSNEVPLWLGAGFTGWLDQVALFRRALLASEVQALYGSADLSWQPATLTTSGFGVLHSSWSSTVPAGLEDTYQINARLTDLTGQHTIVSNIWRGSVDTALPRLDLQAIATGQAYRDESGIQYNEIAYQCTATDQNLDTETFVCPCGTPQEAARRYADDPVLHQYFPDTASPEAMQAACYRWERSDAPAASLQACDIFGLCAERTAPATQDISLPLDDGPVALVVLPANKSAVALASGEPLQVQVAASAPASLQQVTLRLDGEVVETADFLQEDQITEQVLSFTLEGVAAGPHTLEATATDWNRTIQDTLYPVQFTLDTDTPRLTLDTTIVTTTARYTQSIRRVQLRGQVEDEQGINLVQVSNESSSVEAQVSGNQWTTGWTLPDISDGKSYELQVQAVDTAGQQTTITKTVLADLMPPAAVEMSPGYLGPRGETMSLRVGQVVATVSEPTMVLEWEESRDGSGLRPYLAGWTTSPFADPTALQPTTGRQHLQPVEDHQTLYAHLILRDTVGNQRVQTFGPVYVDYQETPDMVDNLDYRGWLQNPCALLSVDTRTSNQVSDFSVRTMAQRLYASWDAETLRLTWSGANWDIAGDLFIYLDTMAGGSNQAYNPYDTNQTITFPEGTDGQMQADYLIWVEDAQQARLLRWNEGAWVAAGELSPETAYRLDAAERGIYTDLLLPFAQPGITPDGAVGLVAFATEEDTLNVWATAPADNPLWVGNAAQTAAPLALNSQFTWPALQSGVCVNGGVDHTSITLEGRSTPGAVSVSFKEANLFQLFNLTQVNPYEKPEQARQRSLDVLERIGASQPITTTPAPLGSTMTYNITYQNQGAKTARGVFLVVRVWGPATLTTPEPGSLAVIPVGDVAPGATASVEVTARVASDPATEAGDRVGVNVFAMDDTDSPQDWLLLTHTIDNPQPTPTPTASPTPTPAASPTLTPATSPTFTPETDPTFTPTASPSITSTATLTPTDSPTATPKATPTGTPVGPEQNVFLFLPVVRR